MMYAWDPQARYVCLRRSKSDAVPLSSSVRMGAGMLASTAASTSLTYCRFLFPSTPQVRFLCVFLSADISLYAPRNASGDRAARLSSPFRLSR